jgi:hypothetical protein
VKKHRGTKDGLTGRRVKEQSGKRGTCSLADTDALSTDMQATQATGKPIQAVEKQ